MTKEIEIPEGYEARIDGNKVIIEKKESEDERTRKALIVFICEFAPEHLKAEFVSYLEKQKEQQPAECIPDSIKFGEGFKTGRELGFREDAGDVPAEWSEEDERKLLEIKCLIGNYRTGKDEYELYSWIDKIKDRVQPQPKQEWSEDYRDEDLRTRFAFYTYKDEDDVLYLSNVFVEETSRNKGFGTKILAAAEKVAETIGATNIRLKVKQDSPANAWYREHGYGYMTFEDGYDWLEKTLEYLKPIKAEWSEEDEKIYQSIMDDTVQENQLNGKQTNWLRDIKYRYFPQPHWKPSEEQMKILRKYVMGEWRDLTIGQDNILTSLYIDLQKLIDF